jgi:hypothetical protein
MEPESDELVANDDTSGDVEEESVEPESDDLVRSDELSSDIDEETEDSGAAEQLISEDAMVDYRSRWDTIQADFVDEPRRSVEEADRLVSEVTEELARTFKQQRTDLETQWDNDDVSTEDLRVALRRYRSFFERLLST